MASGAMLRCGRTRRTRTDARPMEEHAAGCVDLKLDAHATLLLMTAIVGVTSRW
jgi:hypothetical protein